MNEDEDNMRDVIGEAVEAAENARGGIQRSNRRRPVGNNGLVEHQAVPQRPGRSGRIFLHPVVAIEPLKHHNITSLTVNIHVTFFTDGFSVSAFQNVRTLIEIIDKLVYLEKLCLSGPESNEDDRILSYANFPVSILLLMLPLESQSLKSIIVENVNLFGNSAENFRRLAATISRFHVLQTLFFKNVRVVAYVDAEAGGPNENALRTMTTIHQDSTTGLLDPFVCALATLPKLKECYIFCSGTSRSLGALEYTTLRDLCRSKTLTTIFLGGFDIQDGDVVFLSNSIEGNKVLKSLYVDCEIGVRGSEALGNMLRINDTLHALHLSIKNGKSSTEEQNSRRNQKLASAVSWSMLRSFRIHGQGIRSSGGCDSFRSLLQSNYFLDTITALAFKTVEIKDLSDEGAHLDLEIDFYLKLNRAGRQQLLRSGDMRASLVQWVDTLAKVRDDLSCLHYFISINPTLCERRTGKRLSAAVLDEVTLVRGKRKRLYRAAKYVGASYR